MLPRRPLVAAVLAARPVAGLAVAGLGSAAWDLAAATGDDARDFHFIGAMGQAAPFALGLALAQPERRVLLVTGDGELLMGLGALATIGAQAPANLAVLVLDNEVYAETGHQPTATARGTDLAAVAAGCGLRHAWAVRGEDQARALPESLWREAGPLLAVAKVERETLPLVFPPSFDGVGAIDRFRAAATGQT